MPAEKLTKPRLYQIIFLFCVLLGFFLYRTLIYS